MTGLLRVEDLRAWIDTPQGPVRAVDGVDFEIAEGETLALVGESGSGKSMAALALLQLLPRPGGRIVSGRVWLRGEDILSLPERDMRRVRGRRIAMIFQEPQTALNPVFTIGAQIREALGAPGRSRAVARRQAIGLLAAVGIADPQRCYDEFPHRLSGGMKQRAMIAMALAARPEVLVADEPTTALDVTIQAQILELLEQLQDETRTGMLLITHDLGIVADIADRVAVMYAGQIVESAATRAFLAAPRHPYTRKLFRALPSRAHRGAPLEVIRGQVPPLTQAFAGCRFVERCDDAWDRCRREAPRWIEDDGHGVRCHLYEPGVARVPAPPVARPAPSPGRAPPGGSLLRVSGLKVYFPIQRGVLRRVVGHVKAVDDVSFEIGHGRTLALVGESGCGKTTVGRSILQLLHPTQGRVEFGGQVLTELGERPLRRLRRHFQIVFQDPYGSLDPRLRVSEILEEGMRAQGLGDGAARARRVAELLDHVGLPTSVRDRYPHEFSGGQRSRLAIARALAVKPALIVCDEPTSALDVSVQAQILNLLKRLQDELALSYLFITHNLLVVEYLAHEVAVMYLGRLVETGATDEILDHPMHPYTQALLSAVPGLDAESKRRVIRLVGDLPSPSRLPGGCYFHPRCPRAMAVCREVYPQATPLGGTHRVNCHLYSSTGGEAGGNVSRGP